MIKLIRLWLGPLTIVVAIQFAQATRAAAYQIDCAILLCLAGGFPPSAPCAAARAEMIRRITPWPIEPPLQIWRCPMRAGFSGLGATNLIDPVQIAFARTPQMLPQSRPATTEPLPVYDNTVEGYLAAIKVYDLRYSRHRNRDGDCNVSASLRLGSYDVAGSFGWRRGTVSQVPTWVFDTSYTQCSSAWFRGVGLEWRDYEGTQGTEVVHY